MEYALISLGSFVGYVISTIGGGGASLLMVPVVSFLLGPKAIAPVIAIGEELSRPVRLVLFWRDINWSVAKFHVPGSMVGAFIGAYFFTQIDVAWLQIILGLFLISTVFQYQFGQKKRTFRMEALYFLPLGFFVSMGSALFGATGPVENPFYLNYGLEKEKMVATKTINSFMAGLVQLGTYSFFGALPSELWFYGIGLAIGAGLGSYAGKLLLGKMDSKTFRRVVLAVMVVSGVAMIYRQVIELI